jgi:chitodextrinase
MPRKRFPVLVALLATLAATALTVLTVLTGPPAARAADDFVHTQGNTFTLGGNVYRFGAANNYYLGYKARSAVDDVLNQAVAMHLTTIRTWAFIDRGSLDGSVGNVDGPGDKDGVYFQYWDPATGKPAYNDGANGLQMLDYALSAAKARGIRLIMVLTNNWKDFGGMDQYDTWYNLPNHDQFYTDSRTRAAYQAWVSHLLNRTNSITGVKYSDDPTVFAWELANEPRCINANKPTSGTCTSSTLVSWADTMSKYIKSIDTHHLVAVGDEGFLNWGRTGDWPYNGTDGVDHEALTRLPAVDFGTFHLYPNGWNETTDWGTQWIKDHLTAAQAIGKPTLFEEFGFLDHSTRDSVYQTWTSTVLNGGGAAWMFWMIAGKLPDGSNYPDYDGFTVYNPSSTATMFSSAAQAIEAGNNQPPDTSPPTAPGGLAASNVGSFGLTLSWAASTDDRGVTGYDVYQRSGTTDTRLGGGTGLSFQVTGLSAATSYTFVVRAHDFAGNASAASAPLAVTTAPPPALGCKVGYVKNEWQGGFTANVTITNVGTTTISGWTLTWAFAGDQHITSFWNAAVTQTGANVSAANMSYNGTINPGGNTAFGFQATWSGTNAAPTAFTLNGSSCTT